MMPDPTLVRAVIAGFLVAATSASAFAQETRSASLARELAGLLDSSKLESVAAKDPAEPDRFFGALYFPGSELLVVSAKYSAPALLTQKLDSKSYRDVYVDLNSASIPESRVFIEDLMADGLKVKPDTASSFDSYEAGKRKVAFDGDWKKQNLSEDDYQKAFGSADEEYAKILQALVAQLKKAS
jgi:hypothetical protein